MITLALNMGEHKRGKGFWKLNTSLLFDKEYISIIQTVIKEEIEKYKTASCNVNNSDSEEIELVISNQLFFECLKLAIRGKTISYASYKKKLKVNREKALEQKILDFENNIMNNPIDVEQLDELQETKRELQKMRETYLQGVMIRSRARYYEEGEKPSKFFLSLEKKKFIQKVINKVCVGDNHITNPQDILQEQKSFYNRLYTSKQNITNPRLYDTFLSAKHITPLKDSENLKCEGMITLEEVILAIKNMKNNKTPGNDGFPIEFYKIFWKDIGHFLLKSLNEAFHKGELSITQKQGIIQCIPKGDKPRQYLKNWRPITLLNTDYKILSSVLASRMKSVLPSIISSDQKGFLKGRYIGENTRLVYDLISYLNETRGQGLLLLIDFQKAFDTVEWNYIKMVLESYNFGPSFIKWFFILYTGAGSCVINNGVYSSFFDIKRGCRQGDPLSPYIFILAVEPLAMAIKLNTFIKGVRIKSIEYKIGQYADDTFMFLDGKEKSIRTVFKLLDEFGVISGLQVNIEKTCAVRLGTYSNTVFPCPELRIQWVTDFTLLGIDFSSSLKDIEEINYSKAIGKMQNVLKMYSNRKLTLLGKVTILKSLVIPQIIHKLSVLPSPSRHTIDKMYNVFKTFLWDGKRPKLTLEKLALDIENGGLKLTHLPSLFTGLKLSWIKRLNGVGQWQTLFHEIVCEDKTLIWSLDIQSLIKIAERVKNKFWKEVILKWKAYKIMVDGPCLLKTQSILSFPIWNSYWNSNHNVKMKKKSFMNHQIVYINDLLNNLGSFYDHAAFVQHTGISINFLDYNSLISSIPSEWKTIISNSPNAKITTLVPDHLYEEILSSNKVNRTVYKTLINKLHIEISSEQRWTRELNITSSMPWPKIYSIPFSVTMEVKMREFQFKILHRILPTNIFLKLCKIIESDKCYFCNAEPETFRHLFYECPVVQKLWTDIVTLLNPHLDIFPSLNLFSILFGIDLRVNHRLINHIILIVKRYIYVSKCVERNLCVNDFLQMLKKCYDTEIFIANNNRKNPKSIKYIVRKWSPLYQLINNMK